MTPSFRNSPESPLTPGWQSRPPDNKHTRLVLLLSEARCELDVCDISNVRDIQLTRPRSHHQLPGRPSLQDIQASNLELLYISKARARAIPSNTIETKVTILSPLPSH